MISIGFSSRRYAHPRHRQESQSGVTLVEMLVASLMSVMVFLSISMLLSTTQAFRSRGENQTEAQRDASLVLGALARAAQQSSSYAITSGGSGITFDAPGACDPSFQGGPAFQGGRVQMSNGCGVTALLIDGARSRSTQFQMTSISSHVVHARVQITYQGQQNELLETNLFLRNAP